MTVLNTAAIKLSVRKAFEEILKTTMVSQTPPVTCGFENMFVDPTKVVEWVQLTMTYGPDRPLVMGPTPRIISSGFALIVVRVQSSSGTDRSDRLVGIAASAYPYNTALARDGVSVIIDTTDVVAGANDGAWWMVPMRVNWNVWNN